MKNEIKINDLSEFEIKIDSNGVFMQTAYFAIIDLEDGSQDIISVKKYDLLEFVKGTVLDPETYIRETEDFCHEIEYFKDYKEDVILEYYKHKKGAK